MTGTRHLVESQRTFGNSQTLATCTIIERLNAMPARTSQATRGLSSLKHGHNRLGAVTPTYHAWANMIKRCYNANATQWKYYGAKGISVCARWRSSFIAFLADMGECPPGLEIDRWPNQNGNYEPGNCRWATRKQQMRNMSSNLLVEFEGLLCSLAEHCERLGRVYETTRQRIKHGWPIELALKAPPNTKLRTLLK